MKINYYKLDIKSIVQILKKEGRILLTEGQGNSLELVVPESWDVLLDKNGVFLLFELFQIRSIAVPFSEVSLDIVEFTSKPVIYHSPVNENLQNAPVVDGKIKFAMIREDSWKQLLYNFGRPLIYKKTNKTGVAPIETKIKFPLLTSDVKEMFLGPEGEVKILNG